MTFHISTEDLRVLDDGPRVQDLRLAEALGFERPRTIRQLIERNIQELGTYGEVCCTMQQTHQDTGGEVCDTMSQTHQDTAGDDAEPAEAKPNKGGRPGREYWLNEPQALLLSMFARTGNAAEVRRMLIHAFLEWKRAHRRPAEGERIDLPPAGEAETPLHLQPPSPSMYLPQVDEAVPADTLVRLAKVREARVLFGRRAAARVWQEVGFTVPDEAEHLYRKTGLDEGRACLAWLLGQEAGEGWPLVRTLVEMALANTSDSIDARRQLIRLGMKPFRGGLFVANGHPWLTRVFADTEWDNHRHSGALRRLPGTRPDKTWIGDVDCRGTFVPLSLIEEPQMAA